MGLTMQAQAFNPATGTFATANSNIPPGNYQIGLLFETGYDYYFEFGLNVASQAPQMTIFDSWNNRDFIGEPGAQAIPVTGHGSGTASASYAQAAMTVDLFGMYDFGATEYTVRGRIVDPAIESARQANKVASDVLAGLDIDLHPGFVWAGYHMYNAGEIVPLTQKFNIFGRTRDAGTRDYVRFDGSFYVLDDDGYFELTYPTPANKAGGFMINDPGISYNRMRAVGAFEMTYGILESGGLLGGVPGWYESGALVSPFWRQNITERKAHVTVVSEPAAGGSAFTNRADDKFFSTETITLTAEIEDGFFFLGWFDEDDHRLSLANPYTFAAAELSGDTQVIAKFANQPTISIDKVKTILVIGREEQYQTVAEVLTGGFDSDPVFSIEPSLPAGVVFNTATGAVTVSDPLVLVESAAVTYTITARNTINQIASATVDITICNAPEVTSRNLPGGVLDVLFETLLTATGTGPIVFSLTGGALPVGLTMTEDGLISGVPLVSGLFIFAVTATNISGEDYSDTRVYTISIAETPIFMTFSIPNGFKGNSFNMVLAASGSSAEWSIIDGALPSGLTLSVNGLLSGKPTESGTFIFMVKAENTSGSTVKEFSITVYGVPEILTESLEDGIVGLLYTTKMAVDGTTPITWSVVDGALPPGLVLDELDGSISGVPGRAGEYSFTIKAENEFGADIKEFTMSTAVVLMHATPTASVDKLNGNQNRLNIVVTEVYSDRSVVVIRESLLINNNAEGIYRVGNYRVYVNTKGNDQIREIYIVR